MLPEILTAVPGPLSRSYADKLARFEARTVTWMSEDFPIFWERAEGTNVWDVDGNRFLDLTGAFAVASLGHSAPVLREALLKQARSLLHVMGDVHPASGKADLCEALSAITFERWGVGTGKTFLTNSGSEAVEAALKTALLSTGKPGVISFTGGYHGLGYGALEAGGQSYFRDPFLSQLGRFAVTVPYPTCSRCSPDSGHSEKFAKCPEGCLIRTEEAIRSHIREREVGCILVEPIQGRGGEIVPPREFLPMLRRICDEEKILLILDEIYTGFHRTGAFFACDHSQVVPDLICLGKALTGGFPLAACVGRAEVMDAWPSSKGEALHTSTTLGNPLGCAMALASIKEHLRPETRDMAHQAGLSFRKALSNLNSQRIGKIRGLGLMLGMELVTAEGKPDGTLVGQIMLQGLKDGLILLGGGPAGNVLSFSPPFTLNEEEISFVAGKLQEYLISLPGSIS